MLDEYFITKGGNAADKLLIGYAKNETLDDVIGAVSKMQS